MELLAMGATELGAEGGHHPQMLAAKILGALDFRAIISGNIGLVDYWFCTVLPYHDISLPA